MTEPPVLITPMMAIRNTQVHIPTCVSGTSFNSTPASGFFKAVADNCAVNMELVVVPISKWSLWICIMRTPPSCRGIWKDLIIVSTIFKIGQKYIQLLKITWSYRDFTRLVHVLTPYPRIDYSVSAGCQQTTSAECKWKHRPLQLPFCTVFSARPRVKYSLQFNSRVKNTSSTFSVQNLTLYSSSNSVTVSGKLDRNYKHEFYHLILTRFTENMCIFYAIM